MKKHFVMVMVIALSLFGFVVSSYALQEDFDRPAGREKIEKVQKRIEEMKMWKFTKALDLDEKTSAKVFPLMNKHDKQRADLGIAIREDMKNLRSSLKENRKEKLGSILDRLEQNHQSLQKINETEWAELKNILTVEQQAKYIIFKLEFERDMRKIIMEARERKAGRAGKQGPDRTMLPEKP